MIGRGHPAKSPKREVMISEARVVVQNRTGKLPCSDDSVINETIVCPL